MPMRLKFNWMGLKKEKEEKEEEIEKGEKL